MLALRRHTGRLTTEEVERDTFVDEGRFASATAFNPGLRLGRLLVERGTPCPGQLQAALRE